MNPSDLSVTQDRGRVHASGELGLASFRRVLAALHQTAERGFTEVTLDFSSMTRAYPGPMLAVLAACELMRDESDADISLLRPKDGTLRRLFSNANWAHLAAPQRFAASHWHPSSALPATRFRSPDEQFQVVNRILDAVLSSPARLARSHLAAFEWAVNEITDNVLQHADSTQGGLVQLSHYAGRQRLEFAVADAGRGIPSTMRTTRPGISDSRALALAVARGITRDKKVGQGNGLFGTHRASTVGTGDFVIHSGFASIQRDLEVREETSPVTGTLVVVHLDYSDPEALWRALDIQETGADPAGDYIENRYEAEYEDRLQFLVQREAGSVGSRSSGKLARTKVQNLMAMYPNHPVNIDFSDISVVSSSFADEFLGKLFVHTGALRFMSAIRLQNLSPRVRALLDRAILQRTRQEADGD